jgi:hypothetical protein
VVNLSHAPAATDVEKPRKAQSENDRNQKRQKRPDENQSGDYANQNL